MTTKDENNDFLLKTSENQQNTSKFLFIYFIAVVIFGFAVFSIKIIKLIAISDASTLLFFRGFAISFCSLIYSKKDGICLPSYTNVGDTYWLTVRNTSHFLSSLFLVLALNYMRLATAVVFSALYPAIAVVFSIIILKEKFYPRYILGISLCFCGCLIMVLNEKSEVPLPNETPFHNDTISVNFINQSNIILNTNDDKIELYNIVMGLLCGLIHSVSLAMFHVSTKFLINKKVDSNIMNYYMGLIVMILSFILGFFTNIHNQVLYNGFYIISALISGIIFFFAFKVTNYSFKSKLEVLHTTSVGYFQIVHSFILGVLFLNESVYFTDLLGCSIIIVYNILNVMFPIKE